MNIYCIPGLGTDERLFIKLKLENADIKFINWVKPNTKDSISSYADRLIIQIDQSKPFSLLGVSLGGVIAVELSSKINPVKVFVISSVKSSKEFPFYITILKWLKVKYIISSKLLKSGKPLIEFFFGKMNPSDKHLINKMIDDADEVFTPWAAKALIDWQSKDEQIPFKNIVHIIGDKDLIFRHSKIKNCHVIKGGSHLLILNQSQSVNAILNQYLNV
nr:hypothetical protein [Pseudopedobacter sp.]